MKDYKSIDIDELKEKDKELLLEYLKTHFFFKHIQDQRLMLRKQIEEVFTNLKIKEPFRIIDKKNKIATLFQWRECSWKENGEFTNIIPKPFIIGKKKVEFPQKNSFMDIYETLNKEIK